MRHVLRSSMLIFVLSATAGLLAHPGHDGQPLSPPMSAEATVGGATIRVDYGAPSMRGRTILGELVPWDKVWRTGANAPTTLTTDTDLTLGTVVLPKGSYSLFTIPGKNGWTLIVNSVTDRPRHDPESDVGRTEMTVRTLEVPVETLTLSIEDQSDNSGVLRIRWETTEAAVPIRVRRGE
ncbi:MAG TPA: DUF2911 domain-containing protein [Thermoanaerobaculia bacterium]|nr:DUF2911 domain-containing protein [Thermoanaerobaculia bacterium]